MSYSVHHAESKKSPWQQLERWDEGHRQQAFKSAHQYAMDRGGYVCVKDHEGNVVYGTDPKKLAAVH